MGQYQYEKRPRLITCEECGELTAEYRIDSPMVMEASYPDGHKRKGWKEMREASKLNVQAATAKGSTKEDLKKEIRKMGVKFEK